MALAGVLRTHLHSRSSHHACGASGGGGPVASGVVLKGGARVGARVERICAAAPQCWRQPRHRVYEQCGRARGRRGCCHGTGGIEERNGGTEDKLRNGTAWRRISRSNPYSVCSLTAPSACTPYPETDLRHSVELFRCLQYPGPPVLPSAAAMPQRLLGSTSPRAHWRCGWSTHHRPHRRS